MLDIIYLIIAGIIGGIVNGIAGGGSLIMFPALIFSGLSPLIANATNTFSALFSYIFGVFALKDSLKKDKQTLITFGIISLIGGYIGAEALIFFSNDGFETILPFLLLFATLLFAFGDNINSIISHIKHKKSMRLLGILFGFLVCIYGGFFNAGLGILTISYLVFFSNFDMQKITALKLFISTFVAIFAIIRFGIDGMIAFNEGIIVGIGAAIGGYLGGILSKKVSTNIIKIAVIVIGLSLSIYYFSKLY